MKIRTFSALLLTTVLVGGCSSPKFTDYQVSGVFQGKGGAVREVDGIDFWEDGEPGRKYKILGLIEMNHGHRLPLGRLSRIFSGSGSHDSGDHDSAIAKVAHKNGGDAVIFLDGEPEPSSTEDFGEGHHRRPKKLVVVKYLE